MNDRKRILILSVLVTIGVSIASVLVCYYHLYLIAAHGEHPSDPLWMAGGTIVVIFFGGGALLLRINQSVVRRLERLSVDLTLKTEELTRINRELDEFTCVVSHDLKAPLSGIAGYCQILLEHYDEHVDENGRRMLRALVGLCQRLSQLIDDLLSYSRIGRAQPEREPVDLAVLIENVIDRLAPAIEVRHAVVRSVGELPTISADGMLVAEVLQNLVSNGLKFNTSATPTVEIGCRHEHPPAIYVRDNGIGIAPEHRESVFEMFRRLHSRQKFEGTGAGLTIVRRIVEAHGGKIWIESEPGQGTSVLFTLEPTIKISPPHIRMWHAAPHQAHAGA